MSKQDFEQKLFLEAMECALDDPNLDRYDIEELSPEELIEMYC